MLALHASWDAGAGDLVLWAEDGELPASGRSGGRSRTVARRPRPHPFAASADHVAEALGASGSMLVSTAARLGSRAVATVWLPGMPDAPEASPELVRLDDGSVVPAATSGKGVGGGTGARGLRPFVVPALRLSPSAGLDLLVGLPGRLPPGVRLGASVRAFAALAELALEVTAGGRVLPGLVHDGGRHVARWEPLGGGGDDERLELLADALPPACRAVDRTGTPRAVAHHALASFVDALCRDGLRRWRPPEPRGPSGAQGVEAWLAALAARSGEMAGRPGELTRLRRMVAEWRESAAARGGPWRLCFRLHEPTADTTGDEPTGAPDTDAVPWRIGLLLQATDDLSLIVEAREVWRAGEVLRRATRTIDAPHEVLLAELGRAVRVFPELSTVLAEATPAVLETDLTGAHRFLSEVAPALELAGFGVLLPAWWHRPAARLGLRLRASPTRRAAGSALLTPRGLASFDWQAALGDETIELTELRRLAKLKAPLVRVRGQWVELRSDELGKLVAFLGRRPVPRPGTIPDLLRLASGAEMVAAGVPVVSVEAGGLLGALMGGDIEEALEVRDTPEGFSGELRPYQRRGVAWIELLERAELGACLADDMGLGKTATVLAVLESERLRRARGGRRQAQLGPTLVVCPTSVVGNWQREAERFTPALRVVVHHGATRPRGADVVREVADADVVVTSYPLVERDRSALAAIPWRRIVLDEAQHVKNPGAKQTRAVRSLHAPRRLALTGTPVENHLGDLWSIMEILNPGLLGSESAFREEFAIPIERYREEDAAERLRTLTRPFVLRRLKTDKAIIADLPDKMEMKVVCSLTREQATLYQAVVDEMLERIRRADGIERKGLVLATMLRLKQVCNHPAQYLGDGSALEGRSGKLERTVEVLEEVCDGGEKALVFTQFAEMGAMLQRHLQERLGCRVAFLHGGVPRTRRDELVAALQSPGLEVPVMVLSLRAGGTGLNLTAANHVVHFDRWWNPAVENQATDRAFRIGQRRDVQVRKLVCAGTVEDRIDELIESKKDLAARVVGSGEGWLTELSTEELAAVLRLSAETLGAA